MPIHEFKCKSCGHVFEYLCIKSTDQDDVSCPVCKHRKAELLLSAFSSTNSGHGTAPSSCSPSSGFS